jgi:hypothetical protein
MQHTERRDPLFDELERDPFRILEVQDAAYTPVRSTVPFLDAAHHDRIALRPAGPLEDLMRRVEVVDFESTARTYA